MDFGEVEPAALSPCSKIQATRSSALDTPVPPKARRAALHCSSVKPIAKRGGRRGSSFCAIAKINFLVSSSAVLVESEVESKPCSFGEADDEKDDNEDFDDEGGERADEKEETVEEVEEEEVGATPEATELLFPMEGTVR